MARTFADNTSDKVAWTGGPILYNQTAGAVLCWVKRAAITASGGFRIFFRQYAAFNKHVELAFSDGTSGPTVGKIQAFWRTPTGTGQIDGATRFDDDAWHRVALIRKSSSPYVNLVIDGVSDGTQTSDPGQSSTAIAANRWGSNNEGGSDVSSLGGSMARCALISGTTPTIAQTETFLKLGLLSGITFSQWLEMGLASPEADWSGGGLPGTVTAATVGANPTTNYGSWRGLRAA